MRVLLALPGLHRHNRGAEMAFIAVAGELARAGDSVTLIGSGPAKPDAPYRYIHVPSIARENFESFPFFPPLRHEYAYEELTFVPGLLLRYRPGDYDVTLTCNFPFTNWVLRRPVLSRRRPPHVFVTQNGDWPAVATNSEFRFFGCEGLVCINPDFYDRNKDRWRCALIPNGIDSSRFRLGPPQRESFGLPAGKPIVLMVSALTENKRVARGIEAVSLIPEAHLAVAGDGPLRQAVDAAAARLLPGRFTRLSIASAQMPALYRSANILLHLSKDEPFGNVFVEAMASGLPIVAPDSRRLRWIVGDGEFLLTDDSPAVIAAGIRAALDAPPAREVRERKSAAYSWAKIGGKYRDFLQDVINSPGNRR